MHKNGAMLTVACVMLCLTFNYTFPLREESSKWNICAIRNGTQHICDKNHDENVGNTKKMTAQAYIKKALRIMKNASYINENRKNKKRAKCLESNNTDEDLRHFEQMVIKKKNPYLDLKELELRYYNPKNTRQSVDPASIGQDLSLCEPLEDGPNVEITNRGLSGFAIPSKLLKGAIIDKSKTKLENPLNIDNSAITTIAKSKKQFNQLVSREIERDSDSSLLNTLENDIKEFEKNKDAKII